MFTYFCPYRYCHDLMWLRPVCDSIRLELIENRPPLKHWSRVWFMIHQVTSSVLSLTWFLFVSSSTWSPSPEFWSLFFLGFPKLFQEWEPHSALLLTFTWSWWWFSFHGWRRRLSVRIWCWWTRIGWFFTRLSCWHFSTKGQVLLLLLSNRLVDWQFRSDDWLSFSRWQRDGLKFETVLSLAGLTSSSVSIVGEILVSGETQSNTILSMCHAFNSHSLKRRLSI